MPVRSVLILQGGRFIKDNFGGYISMPDGSEYHFGYMEVGMWNDAYWIR